MDGVTILQIFSETSYTWGWSSWFLIPILVCILCGTGMVLAATSQKPNGFVVCICFIGVFVAGLCTTCMAAKQTQLPTKYTYQVLLTEEVNMTEFAQRYEILEQQGITYIIKEKE